MEGKVIQVLGPVIDVEFDGDKVPEINEALIVEFEAEGKKRKVVLEVAAQIGDNIVRTIAMDLTDGLQRGTKVIATGGPIKVPVGEAVLGRIFNVTGDPIDEGEPIPADVPRWSIHRDPPPFEEQSTKMEVFETGIKVVDLLCPYMKGGKTGLFGGAGVHHLSVAQCNFIKNATLFHFMIKVVTFSRSFTNPCKYRVTAVFIRNVMD